MEGLPKALQQLGLETTRISITCDQGSQGT